LRWRWGDCFEGEEKYRTSGLPDAEDAKVTQKTQKKIKMKTEKFRKTSGSKATFYIYASDWM
jgi:hypothetical protein